MIYLNTAALVKLIRVEAESPALVSWLNARAGQPLVASALVEVEVPRALKRSQPDVLGAVAGVLARLHRIEINTAVRATAGGYPEPSLRSLDAIHLATAELLVASGSSYMRSSPTTSGWPRRPGWRTSRSRHRTDADRAESPVVTVSCPRP